MNPAANPEDERWAEDRLHALLGYAEAAVRRRKPSPSPSPFSLTETSRRTDPAPTTAATANQVAAFCVEAARRERSGSPAALAAALEVSAHLPSIENRRNSSIPGVGLRGAGD